MRESSQRFPRTSRVRSQLDFNRVYQGNVYAADNVLVVRAASNGLAYPRLGLSVSKKVGNAVCRNRWKRLIREAFRRQQAQLPAGLDLVVRPRKGASPNPEAIMLSLERLCRRLARSTRNSPAGRGQS